ncbi:MAG: Hsp70 family protein, partial [Chloroflexi bacterium]|nr:Hsp70 family protein [Chloroflexota bacterium]
DITILQIGEGVFEVKSTNGDTHLGGDDFDQTIVDYIANEFKATSGIDIRQDPSAHQRVRVEAERAKIELSSVAQTEVNLPFISADASGPKHLHMTLTRAKLEDLTASLVERTVAPCRAAIKDAGIKPSDIDEVVLVGGMTRMPSVSEKVKQIFGKEPNKSINPDEVVAIGAAIQGGVLQGEVKDVLLLDVTPLTWGIETLGGVKTPLIERNTTIPASKSEIFTTAADGQTSVEIHVLQGERPMASDNISVGRFTLDGIPPAPRGRPQVEVTFDLDADGILTVSAKDKGTNREQHITITGRSGLAETEVERLMKEAEEHAEEDRKRKERVESRNTAESAAFQAEKALSDFGDKVSEDVKSDVQGKIDALRELLKDESTDPAKLVAATTELQKSVQKIGEEVYAADNTAGAAGAETSPEDGQDEGEDTVEGEFREV